MCAKLCETHRLALVLGGQPAVARRVVGADGASGAEATPKVLTWE